MAAAPGTKPPAAGKGRVAGVPNKTTALLKDAILKAADGAHKDGLVGYLKTQATANPGPFMALLGKVLPMQLTGEGGGPVQVQRVERVIVDPANTDRAHLRAIAGGKPV